MLEPVIEGFLDSLAKEFAKYDIIYETLYNSDLNLLTQYSQSLNLRSLFSTSDLSLLPEDLVKQLKGDSYNHLMYNYSPFRRNKDRMNNINFNAVFDHTQEQGLAEFTKLKALGNDGLSHFFESIRKTPIPEDIREPIVRDMVMGEVDLTFKVLSYNTSLIQNMQFVYVQTLQRNRAFDVELDFGQAGKCDFEYEVEFKDIDSVGHVDFAKFGNLQELTFTVRLSGPFFSFYQYTTRYIETIALELKFSTER